jgi:sporadic carbohydrate cluster protein (TIGR04323 family)
VIAKGYISSRSFMGERVPQSVQNLVLRNFCKNNNLIFELSSTEYAMKESYYVLNQLLVSKKYKCIVLYSLFQLPKN